MKFHLDYRLELLTCVSYLSGTTDEGFLISELTEYTDFIDNYFTDYKHHPVLEEFSSLWKDGMGWVDIPRLALNLTEHIILRDDADITNGLWSNSPEKDNRLRQFVSLLRDFALQSDFTKFYHQEELKSADYIDFLNQQLAKRPLKKILEDYLRIELGESSVVLTNLLRFSCAVTLMHHSKKEIYSFCSRYWFQVAQNNNNLENAMASTIWHECLHSVINPLSANLFINTEDMTQNQIDWFCALNESIIWAITLRLLIRESILSDRDIEWYCEDGRQNKAPQTREMHDLLLEYEAKPSKFENIVSFYPVLQAGYSQVPEE